MHFKTRSESTEAKPPILLKKIWEGGKKDFLLLIQSYSAWRTYFNHLPQDKTMRHKKMICEKFVPIHSAAHRISLESLHYY